MHINASTNPSEAVKASPSLLSLPLVPIPEMPEIDLPSASSTSGTATIWYSSPRPTEEILEGLVVSMPDYVSDLLAGLDIAASPQSSVPPAHRLAAPHPAEIILPVPTVSGLPKQTPKAVLSKSPSRRPAQCDATPRALSSRIGPSESRVLPTWQALQYSATLEVSAAHATPTLSQY